MGERELLGAWICSPAVSPDAPLFRQRDQPAGVPPLSLTGERTLPDVPQENYWYRRHLVVYEWIAAQVAGRRVIDMASGEGYGTATLAQEAATVTGVEANPEAFEHSRLRYAPGPKANVRFERSLIQTYAEPADAIVFLQTIEHVQEPGEVLDHFRSVVGPDGVVFLSTPNVLTLAPKGAERSGNPWHVHEYRTDEFAELCERHFARVELYGLFHAGKLRVHQWALNAGWDRVHALLRLTGPFYDWFTPAISVGDFVLRPAAEADLDGALDFVAVCRP
jgi:SAM-dependent methyltransferase